MIYLMYKSAKFGLVLTVTYLQIYIYIYSIFWKWEMRKSAHPFGIKSYHFECNDCNACSQTTMTHHFAFGYFEKTLTQENCLLFCKKYEKESIILTVFFQLENVPFNIKSYRFECNDYNACSQTIDSSFCFWVFEKRLTQGNCFLFGKKYGLFNGFIFLTIKKFLLPYFPNFHGQRSGGTRS